jgi:hypothetical protein
MKDPWLADEARLLAPSGDLSVSKLCHSTRAGINAGVWRVSAGSWRAVVKVLSSGRGDPAWAGSCDPTHHRYWAREWRILQARPPDRFLAAGLRAPTLLRAFERPDGTVALWLEYQAGRSGKALGLTDLADVAFRFGQAQALPPSDADRDAAPWSRNFFCEFVDSWSDAGWSLVSQERAWRAPRIARHVGPRLRGQLASLCAERAAFASLSRRLPVTICHNDLWVNNLIVSSKGPVVIDWAYAGFGARGHDAGNLVMDLCGELLYPAAGLPEADRAVSEAYLEGLRSAGWRDDPRAVRLAMCLTVAKWAFLVPTALRQARQEELQVYGARAVDPEHLYAEWAIMFEFFAERAMEARRLVGELGLS